MDMTGERRIPAPRERVWTALNDPAVLKSSIPGCESLEKVSDTEMKALVGVKIGPIAARFNGRVQLADLDPPRAYTISGDGQGGAAGFAKGGAKVALDENEGATLLHYAVQAQVGGKIAQLGARLIDASAKQLADQFFDNFTRQLSLGEAGAPAAPRAEEAAPVIEHKAPPAAISVMSLVPSQFYGLPLIAWIGGFLWLLVLVLIAGLI
jgi:carbon monoxide dehydrogenase subunit G